MPAHSISDEDLARIKEYLSQRSNFKRNYCLIIIGIYTGFRIAELLSIKISSLYNPDYSKKQTIKIERKNMKGKKKSRIVIINDEIWEPIEDYLSDNPHKYDDFLFKGRNGHLSYSSVAKLFDSIRDALNIEHLSSHSCRKTFAQCIYEMCDRDIFITQQALGHTNINSTIKYLNKDGDKINELIKNLKHNR